jgi:UDP-N-acetylmuramoyl-tripeptide--D-alanyl-D-alanine ligase
MEVGISEARDMDELGQMLRPDAALILNVGEAHLNGLGERGVAANKALFLDYIQSGGLALVSADYPDLLAEVEKRGTIFADKGVDLAFFSAVSRNAFSWAEYLGQGSDFAGQYRVFAGGREFCVSACFQGDFGSENVAAIAAAASKMGLRAEEIAQGFSGAKLPGQRFNCRRHGDLILVDDSYNANPLSSTRMIRTCRSMADDFGAPLYLVMGEMLELGDRTEEAHEELGRTMAAAVPAKVFWKGGQAGAVLSGLRRGGYGNEFYPLCGGQEFSLLLEEFDPQSGLFLFKGSRLNNLERLAAILRERVGITGGADAV